MKSPTLLAPSFAGFAVILATVSPAHPQATLYEDGTEPHDAVDPVVARDRSGPFTPDGQTSGWSAGPDEPCLKNVAAFQRCFGLDGPISSCSPLEFIVSDMNGDGTIDLCDFNRAPASWWPPPMTIHCGFAAPQWYERCSPDCLPEGDVVQTGDPVPVFLRPACYSSGCGSAYRIQVAGDADSLEALVDPTPLGGVDFQTNEVIVFTTEEAVEQGCWGAVHCYNGVVDLPDGRRAVVVGTVQHGYLICLAMPRVVARAVVVPRSQRPVVMLFIERDATVTQIVRPICD